MDQEEQVGNSWHGSIVRMWRERRVRDWGGRRIRASQVHFQASLEEELEMAWSGKGHWLGGCEGPRLKVRKEQDRPIWKESRWQVEIWMEVRGSENPQGIPVLEALEMVKMEGGLPND